MTIDTRLYQLQSTPNVAAGWDERTLDFVLNLEVLNWCAHHCPGCFVRRKNNITGVDLNKALDLAQSMVDRGLRFREVVLSPTDIFSAKNSIEILKNKKFQRLLNLHPKTRITTTAMFENVNMDNMIAVFNVLDNPDFYRENMILEFLVPMNVEKILERDKKYYTDFKRATNFLTYETPKEVDWSLAVNVHHDPMLFSRYDELTDIAREQFNTIIEFLPSFFRTGNDNYIIEHLSMWRTFLRTVINEDNYRNMLLTVAEMNHNTMNTIVLNYNKNRLFISPFIYEQILFDYPQLEVEGDVDSIFKKVQELVVQQYAYAPKTTECSRCQYLNTCVGRNVLSFMEIKCVKDCIYPKEILNLYSANNIDSRSRRVKKCDAN